MADRKKHQQSSIDRLPDDVREAIQSLLRDPRVTDLEATARINEVLAAEGHDAQLSKSAVNRYALRMREVGRKLEESRETAKMWIGRLGSEPAGEVGKLVNEMVRTLAFRVVMRASEEEDEDISVDDLKSLAISVHRLEQAAEKNAAVEAKIRHQAREQAMQEAVDTVEQIAQKGGLSKDISQAVRRQLLGLSS
jgi:hypothetical protein